MTAHDLVTDLGRACREGRLDRRMRLGGGIFNRNYGEFSTGVDTAESPGVAVCLGRPNACSKTRAEDRKDYSSLAMRGRPESIKTAQPIAHPRTYFGT